MTYLDDPDFTWEIEPGAVDDLNEVLNDLTNALTGLSSSPEEMRKSYYSLTFKGIAGLIDRHSPDNPIDLARCIHTAIIWAWG